MKICMTTYFRIVAETNKAIFGLPEVNLGMLPIFSGLAVLPRRVGIGAAKEIIFTGERFGIEKALKLGVINQVVPPERLMEATMEFAKKMRKKNTNLIRLAKYMMNKSLEIPLSAAFEKQKEIFEIFASKFKKENIKELWKEFFP